MMAPAALMLSLLNSCLAETHPNIIIMMADDWGYGDWSRTGAQAITPHLEEMSRADTAAWFERAYSGNPICSPTRASVMTGRTPSRTCIYGVEQHILCHPTPNKVGGCTGAEFGIGNATQNTGYNTGFFGKWHMGSLRNDSADCYSPLGATCNPGEVSRGANASLVCCQGSDGHLMVSNPHHFGFDEWVATPQCGPSGTTNCGCFFKPPRPTNTSSCLVGHYKDACSSCAEHLECAQYYVGNTTRARGVATPARYVTEPLAVVSDANDEDFLISHLESLARRSVATGTPFLGVVFFHGVHIPYVAAPEYKALYKSMISHATGKPMDENEMDYWGTVSQIDAAVGRVRGLLKELKIAPHTWVSLHADNGPEVSPANGQGTGTPFSNPGRTDGLRGRKRDLTEGGIREIGLVEYPPLIRRNIHEPRFPIVTMDLMATVLDLVGSSSYKQRPLDGISLLPYFRGDIKAGERPAGIGWYGIFDYGSTNHANPNYPQPGTGSKGCPDYSAAAVFGDIPANFSTPGHQPQWAWSENDLKLFGCKSKSNGVVVSDDVSDDSGGWHFFLYDLVTDRNESVDLWESSRPVALAMFGRFQQWQQSVLASQGPEETGCADAMLPVPFFPVPGMSNVKARCAAGNDNKLGQAAGSSPGDCAGACHATGGCQFFSFAAGCAECWLFKSCAQKDSNPGMVYKWSSYGLRKTTRFD